MASPRDRAASIDLQIFFDFFLSDELGQPLRTELQFERGIIAQWRC